MEENIKSLRRKIYKTDSRFGDNKLLNSPFSEFTPSNSEEYVELQFSSWEGSERKYKLCGDGKLYTAISDEYHHINTISPQKLKSIFKLITTSGILNYCNGVVDLKEDLYAPEQLTGSVHDSKVKIFIDIPTLKTSKMINMNSPEIGFKNFPDIVEYKIVDELLREIMNYVPMNYR